MIRAAHASVAIVTPVVARHDAISASARDTYFALAHELDLETAVFTLRNDHPEVPAYIVAGLADLLLNARFRTADIVLYHFGVYCELFDALIAAKDHSYQIVRFHNITPAQFVSAVRRSLIERSFRQLQNLTYADELWADSETNAEVLASRGITQDHVSVIPLAVERPAFGKLSDKSAGRLNILFVGRLVPAKGAMDLIKAAAMIAGTKSHAFQVSLAGSTEWADDDYVAEIRNMISSLGLKDIVEVHGDVEDRELDRLYHQSHILAVPSYHEGFCKPVIEGLRTGCIPVTYDGYNLPAISGGFGRVVPTGDIELLAESLMMLMTSLREALGAPERPLLPLVCGTVSVHEFDERAAAWTSRFTFDRFRATTVSRVQGIAHRQIPSSSAVESC